MRVLVCGGRDFADYAYLEAELDSFEYRIQHLIQGGCKSFNQQTRTWDGADFLAKAWANAQGERGPTMEEFPANWSKYGRAAGPIRNQQMLDEGKPHLVLAFAGGRGTDSMCQLARTAGIEVRRYWPGALK